MRLVCPSCDAEYEIARSAIPRSGRAVECSNCGHSWFQAFADLRLEEALNETDRDSDQAAPPRALDEAVLEVLREETAREVMARQAEADRAIPQMQTEMPVNPRADHAPALNAGDDGLAAVPQPRPRRDLLPAIDDISDNLHESPAYDAGQMAPQDLPKVHPGPLGRSVLVLALAGVILLALYVFAPEIAARVPALSKASGDYVAMVDRAMAWGQVHLGQAVQWLQALWHRIA